MLTKFISLLLAVFILSQSFNLHIVDVLKFQNLLEHIAFHESTYGDDFFSFISKHYGLEMAEHKSEKDSTEDHQQLPFNRLVLSDSGPLYVCDIFIEKLVFSTQPNVEKQNFYYYNFYTFLGNSEIFQPPRIA